MAGGQESGGFPELGSHFTWSDYSGMPGDGQHDNSQAHGFSWGEDTSGDQGLGSKMGGSQDMSQVVAEQFHRMYTFFQSALGTERSRHTSEVGLLMRKVDKDLKDTFKNVQGTLRTLTEQVLRLNKALEIEKQKTAILSDKYRKAKGKILRHEQIAAEMAKAAQAAQLNVEPDDLDKALGTRDDVIRYRNRYQDLKRQHEGEVKDLKVQVARLKEALLGLDPDHDVLSIAKVPRLPAMRAPDIVLANPKKHSRQEDPEENLDGTRPLSRMSDDSRATRPTVDHIDVPAPTVNALHTTRSKSGPSKPAPTWQNEMLQKTMPRVQRQYGLIKMAASAILLVKEVFSALACPACGKPLDDPQVIHPIGSSACRGCCERAAAEATPRKAAPQAQAVLRPLLNKSNFPPICEEDQRHEAPRTMKPGTADSTYGKSPRARQARKADVFRRCENKALKHIIDTFLKFLPKLGNLPELLQLLEQEMRDYPEEAVAPGQ
eukprot:CAMPEP_0204382258 /NCGR_PEP_ID=MMETSP0469-20131031/54956_1 /ASSEMBLY_ACC=CAM_ASM_000384 /TAXON_ID=2969 /ORGANISM="Oxyrrhis marina" /LENGTH=489 /DNA_ID=CAMNT_0051374285 /DNA_START=10 /DNA_END=1479 /DNA_ORIENTATION=+